MLAINDMDRSLKLASTSSKPSTTTDKRVHFCDKVVVRHPVTEG